MKNVDIAIIGGGPAGLAAAAGARRAGAESILILERESHLGGILNQCIHNGFGLHRFKEELTGPEYAARYEQQIKELCIPFVLNTMVLEIAANGISNPGCPTFPSAPPVPMSGQFEKKITAVNRNGVLEIDAKAVILAMGCRERPRGQINIPGSRPAGVYTAGTAQKFVNLDGYMPGKKVVVLGSGDIGLIMARRMTFEGANVLAVVEIMPYSSGLKRNIVQCLDDFGIPLRLSHTVTEICGKKRLEGVKVARVDENRRPILHTEEYIPCDTLLLSVGLIPENELSEKAGVKISGITGGPIVNESFQTNVDGVFACGNVLHVHDLVDFVSEESEAAGAAAAAYVRGGGKNDGPSMELVAKSGVRYVVPGAINPQNVADKTTVRFRVTEVFKNRHIAVYFDKEQVQRQKKQILTPGEMEAIILKKEVFDKHPNAKSIAITVEG